MPDENAPAAYQNFFATLFGVLDGPVTYVKEKLVDPVQSKNKQYYYHRRFRRVPTIDQCDIGDAACRYEAAEQYKRDKLVDNQIVKILRQRKLECYAYEGADAERKCHKVVEDYEGAATNWFIKYGDLGANTDVVDALMKQKHRLIWERQHGRKVGQ